MITTGKLQRLLLIVDRVRQNPSFADLQDHLQRHGIALSARTLQRDVELMRDTLGLDVRYDRESNTYRLSGAQHGHDSLIALVERASLGELLTANTAHLKDLGRVLELPGTDRLQGLVHWLPLAKAAHERRWVNVTRQVGGKTSPAQRLKPLRLREQDGRWTLVAQDAKDSPVEIGLDQVHGVQVTTARFPAPVAKSTPARTAAKPSTKASATAGERVVLRTTATLGAQLAQHPLHASQKTVKQGAESHLYELTAPLDEHLLRSLMGHGAELRVMEPASLVKRIAKAHKAAAKQYK
jgi:proteasome accessory factor B